MKNWKRYLWVAGLLVFLVMVQSRNAEIDGPHKGILGNILNPFIYQGDRLASAVVDGWRHYIFLSGVSKANDQMKQELGTLRLENSILSEKLVELDNLYKLLKFRDSYHFESNTANVISRSVNGYIKSITIDRGSSDGVAVDSPVISSDGLVGKISRVYRGTSEVTILQHHESSVSVMNSRTRAVGMLKGDGHGGMYVDYYDRLDDAFPGDVLITSGMGQLYPKGIRCGVVEGIISAPTGLFQKLIVESTVDFYKLEQVLVLNRDVSAQESSGSVQ